MLSKSLNTHSIKNHKNEDWFLGLAYAMHENKEPLQARMPVRILLFFHDHLPRGLTGEYVHIRGSEVMHHLLSSREQEPHVII